MTVGVVAYARLREIVGASRFHRTVATGSSAGDLWDALASEFPALAGLGGSTRFVRADVFIGRDAILRDGDEIGLLPPFGGG